MQNRWKRVWKTILITILIGFSLIVVWHLTKDKDIQEQNNTNDPSLVVGFASCEEVESISEEEISAIVDSDDKTTDYIHDLAYEQNLYGVDLYGAGTEQAEQFRYTCIMLPDGTGVKQKYQTGSLDSWQMHGMIQVPEQIKMHNIYIAAKPIPIWNTVSAIRITGCTMTIMKTVLAH